MLVRGAKDGAIIFRLQSKTKIRSQADIKSMFPEDAMIIDEKFFFDLLQVGMALILSKKTVKDIDYGLPLFPTDSLLLVFLLEDFPYFLYWFQI